MHFFFNFKTALKSSWVVVLPRSLNAINPSGFMPLFHWKIGSQTLNSVKSYKICIKRQETTAVCVIFFILLRKSQAGCGNSHFAVDSLTASQRTPEIVGMVATIDCQIEQRLA